jgi:AraC family transcriptional regulator of adaptative response / DNA-3-methyladenine glycosylase II
VCFDGDSILPSLRTIAGIGEWTAQYVAMRALNEPDAFPSGDLVLRRMAGDLSTRELDRRSESWRPWRAYAVMLLWRAATDLEERNRRTRHATVAAVLPRTRERARVPA